MSEPHNQEPPIEWIDVPENKAEEPDVSVTSNLQEENEANSFWRKHPKITRAIAAAALVSVGGVVGGVVKGNADSNKIAALGNAVDNSRDDANAAYNKGIAYGQAVEEADRISEQLSYNPVNFKAPRIAIWEGLVQQFQYGTWRTIIKDPIILADASRANQISASPQADPALPTYLGVFGFEGRSNQPIITPYEFRADDRFVPADVTGRQTVRTLSVYIKNMDVSNGTSPADLGLVGLDGRLYVATDRYGEITPGRAVGDPLP